MASILLWALKYRNIITGASIIGTLAYQIYSFVENRAKNKKNQVKLNTLLNQQKQLNARQQAFEATLAFASEYAKSQIDNWTKEVELTMDFLKPKLPNSQNDIHNTSELTTFFQRQLAFQLARNVTCLIFYRFRLMVVKMVFVCFTASLDKPDDLENDLKSWFATIPKTVNSLTDQLFNYIFNNVNSVIYSHVKSMPISTKLELNIDMFEKLDNFMRKALVTVVNNLEIELKDTSYENEIMFQQHFNSMEFKMLIIRPALELYQEEIPLAMKTLNKNNIKFLPEVSNFFVDKCSSFDNLLNKTMNDLSPDLKKLETQYLLKVFNISSRF